ncbi:MAG: hypothetical protein Solumvirus2_50 [Solumvirus sp.]|uniref:Uncharacterized protein n=1 Tax=Solumvirus sp. TaxID=2487773 RepID=A0A3G5AJQ5_9VIRU|nr:MAG: hypothetical protein Solumvirus2_50 [Solumvirus sp.]
MTSLSTSDPRRKPRGRKASVVDRAILSLLLEQYNLGSLLFDPNTGRYHSKIDTILDIAQSLREGKIDDFSFYFDYNRKNDREELRVRSEERKKSYYDAKGNIIMESIISEGNRKATLMYYQNNKLVGAKFLRINNNERNPKLDIDYAALNEEDWYNMREIKDRGSERLLKNDLLVGERIKHEDGYIDIPIVRGVDRGIYYNGVGTYHLYSRPNVLYYLREYNMGHIVGELYYDNYIKDITFLGIPKEVANIILEYAS